VGALVDARLRGGLVGVSQPKGEEVQVEAVLVAGEQEHGAPWAGAGIIVVGVGDASLDASGEVEPAVVFGAGGPQVLVWDPAAYLDPQSPPFGVLARAVVAARRSASHAGRSKRTRHGRVCGPGTAWATRGQWGDRRAPLETRRRSRAGCYDDA